MSQSKSNYFEAYLFAGSCRSCFYNTTVFYSPIEQDRCWDVTTRMEDKTIRQIRTAYLQSKKKKNRNRRSTAELSVSSNIFKQEKRLGSCINYDH